MKANFEEMVTKEEQKIKCVVWDLDNTIWDGVLLEDKDVFLRPGIVDIIKTLDDRGILQSVSSKNDHDIAMKKLNELGLDDYFIYPQINWNPKSVSIKEIVQSINIGMDTIAFIDDQRFERDEVSYNISEVLCLDSEDLSGLLEMSRMNPKFITSDSKMRRKMYQSDMMRKRKEEEFSGAQQEFLESLGMVFTISEVKDEDLKRAEELTVRTHQLNTTGYTYSYEELEQLRSSENHKLFIAGLEDKYGTYGKIGLMLLECESDVWTLKLLLMSCRVMSRGVGTVFIGYIMKMAKECGVKLRAEFVSNDKNRMMLITYKFLGFKQVEENGNFILFENDLSNIQDFPDYMTVKIESTSGV